MIIGRPFCRFLCPYGALLGLFASLASRKVSVTPGDCTNCQLCENVCPYNAVLPPSPIPNETEKRRGLQQLLLSFLLFPILIIGFGILGYYVAPKLAPLHHTVKTAALIYAEEQKLVALPGSFSETHAVMLTGESNGEIYQQALQVIQRFRITGIGFGIWCGLVIGLKLVVLSLHRRRLEYSISPSRCYACGRCFWYCPNQKNERILLDESDSRRSEKL
jgi:ferredoxin